MNPIPTKNLKIKVFSTNSSKQKSAQEWFDSNPNLEIMDIQYTGKGASSRETGGFALMYHYREIEKDMDDILP